MRCFGDEHPLYAKYHDDEWGVPLHDDQKLFEMLTLEGAQAGLSWFTILKRREGYQKSFHNFDPQKVAQMSDEELENLMHNPAIIRNRLKIWSTRQNAQAFLQIQKEFGSFDNYLKAYAPKPIIGNWKEHKDVPISTKLSDDISKDLKKRGMKFVGTTIIYAFCQAIGLVNDHLTSCPKYHA
ncbi:MAG: DNA-3-methyladenine glycosylase 1 [Chlamydiales bacterium]|nr:DNA-3-methyladenine glycosylase 1 [Chlamydiales bacterium]